MGSLVEVYLSVLNEICIVMIVWLDWHQGHFVDRRSLPGQY